jgi:tetratricopeptide (TPR) repeat protein
VGRLAKRRAENARAETWFRRTVALARQAGDWPTYALAFDGLGNLYAQRGNFPAARRLLVRSLRAAGRNSLHDIEGMAQHDLFTVAGETGNVDEANEWARRAFQSYGPLHPSLPRLANDVAFFWCEQGCFAPALPVLQSVLKHFTEPTHRVAVLGAIGRAAGGLGDRATFQQAWDDAHELIGANGLQDMGARACLDLAHGALSLGAWERAEDAAQRALDGAMRRGDAKTRLVAEALVEAARRHQHAERAAATSREAWRDTAEVLSTDLVGSLEG